MVEIFRIDNIFELLNNIFIDVGNKSFRKKKRKTFHAFFRILIYFELTSNWKSRLRDLFYEFTITDTSIAREGIIFEAQTLKVLSDKIDGIGKNGARDSYKFRA